MRVLATVTVTRNLLASMLLPILGVPEVEEVVFVTDDPDHGLDHPKLRTVLASPRANRLATRAGAKALLLRRLAKELRPEWILSWYIMPHGVNGAMAARASGAKSMYHQIGGWIEWEGGGWASENAILGRLPRPSKLVEGWLLRVPRSSTLVGVMGNHGRDRLVAEGVPRERIVITPGAIDTARFSPDATATPDRDIVAVGRLVAGKRFADVVAAVATLRDRGIHASAAILGDGPERGAIAADIARLGVEDRVEILGHVEAVEDVLRRSRVFTLPSASEGLSVAMMEAMACGLPAVVTDVGDLGDLVRPGRNGVLVPVARPDLLADALAATLADEARRREMGRAAREDVVAYAGLAACTERYRRILLGIGGGWDPPQGPHPYG